jgi:hypothetical protein
VGAVIAQLLSNPREQASTGGPTSATDAHTSSCASSVQDYLSLDGPGHGSVSAVLARAMASPLARRPREHPIELAALGRRTAARQDWSTS